ncbi:hypothetical protein L3Y34_002713 [Caenorhabditis briggsae]|uniref:Uncharacterized protein n=1 Tax=Caenorhabditis briggsae TaxID=6238 RepID=A0AAE9IS82_CAEBR|nr:hypothetical protein L3Y34_002713 [Caenorhabditis briggsae]
MVVDGIKKWWSSEKPEDNGWNISGKLGSASSTVTSYSSSAASSIGSAAKSAWNSEAAAATSSAISSATKSTASYVADRAKSTWNSEAAAATSSAIGSATKSTASYIGNAAQDAASATSSAIGSAAKSTATYVGDKVTWNSESTPSETPASSGIWSATSRIKSWWNGTPDESESSGDSVRGVIAAMSKNASKYVVQAGGRSSNILNIFDKTQRSSLGNPKWWIRFDRPHGNVDFHHINVNKAITGIKDPHTKISPVTAKAVGYFGKVAEKANDVAPILTTAAMIYEAFRIGNEVKKDYDHGTTRNTVQTVATTTATYSSGFLGGYAGGLIGSSIFPGLGTIFGGIVGGVIAASYGGYYSHVASEMALDRIQWDLAKLECVGCKEEYTWKKYQEIQGVCCTPFNSKRQECADFWHKKLMSNHDF